jgi:hypothetical protein
MRTMMTVTVPVEKGNEAIKNGTLGPTIEATLKKLKPEAAYFGPITAGQRTAWVVFDMSDPSQIPEIAEPLFLGFDAAVEFVPVMNAEDLQKGLAKAAAARKN